MKLKLKLIKEILTKRKWILLFQSYFFFFLLFTSYDLGVAIYLEQINQTLFWSILLIINQISIILMPIIVTRICEIVGNIRFTRWSLLALFLMFISTFILKEMVWVIFLTFPVFLRIFNNSLNPFISTEVDSESLSLIFAIRDMFLFTGISVGLIISSFIFANSFSIVVLIQFFSIFLLISCVLLFFIENKINKRNKEIKKKLLEFPLKNIAHKKILIIFTLISSATYWISFVIKYLPFYFADLGLFPSEIFFSYAITYLIVPILAIIATLFVSEKNSKKWYLFDLGFDIVPFILIIFADLHISVIVIGLLLIQIRDFLAPIGLSYFFKNFNKEERNEAWGVWGTLTSIFSLPFPLLIGFIFGINHVLLFLISITIIILSVLIAYLLLPNLKGINKNP